MFWRKVTIAWVDERNVPHSHSDIQKSADQYLAKLVAEKIIENGIDIANLGISTDGHTAS